MRHPAHPLGTSQPRSQPLLLPSFHLPSKQPISAFLFTTLIHLFSKYLFGSCEMPGAGAALQAQEHQEFLGNQERKELPPQLRQ